jgi:exodeoxyribonuclease VII small subunit
MAEEEEPDVAAASTGAVSPAEGLAALSYEEARDELTAIVARLEGGQVPLEESMALWRRGEALAAHCSTWLDAAEASLSASTDPASESG